MIWTSNPVADAERHFCQQFRLQEEWEREHFVGLCPLCGKPMYDSVDAEFEDRAVEHSDYVEGYVHEWCQICKEEEEEVAEAERLAYEMEEALA